MKEFDYKAYVADNWLLKEAQGPATAADLKGFATKDATLARQKRAQKGNWEGSVGKYVEDHRAEIDDAFRNGNLRAYIVSTMKPALSPESQEYVEGTLLTGYASNKQLYQALYNIMLKGQGLGLHEENTTSKDVKVILQDLINTIGWKGEEDTVYVGNGEAASITFNCDPMAYFNPNEEEKINQFAQQNSVDVIPFVYDTHLSYNGEPWNYGLLASGFIIRNSTDPKVFRDHQDLEDLNMPNLVQFIDNCAPDYSDDGEEM